MTLDIAGGLLDQVEMVVDETTNLPPGPSFFFQMLLKSEHNTTTLDLSSDTR